MTWRELFRRAWLVLRLRRKTFQLCMDCGVPLLATLEKTEYSRCDDCYQLDVLAQREEMKRRAAQRGEDHNIYLRQLVARQNEAAMANHVAWAASRPLDPALLQNQIGAPIRVPAHYLNPGLGGFVIGEIGSAIGSAIELLPFKDYLT